MPRKLYAIIGDPIAQVRSPAVFNRLFIARGVDAQMIALQVRTEGLRTALDGLAAIENFAGAIITIPHKSAAAALARDQAPRAQITGVANALKPGADGWCADLFDGMGFVQGLAREGHLSTVVAAPSVAVVGLGGAGRAIVLALLDAGVACVAISDMNTARTEMAYRKLGAYYPNRLACRAPNAEDALVVNATPMGMCGDDPLPVDLDGLAAQALIADVVMTPPHTRLLREATQRGHPTHAGCHMLDAQVDALWQFFEMGNAQ